MSRDVFGVVFRVYWCSHPLTPQGSSALNYLITAVLPRTVTVGVMALTVRRAVGSSSNTVLYPLRIVPRYALDYLNTAVLPGTVTVGGTRGLRRYIVLSVSSN